jgi:hypothetical protein
MAKQMTGKWIRNAFGAGAVFYLRIENFVDDTDRSGAFPQCRVLDFLV